jgi:hypothetical protein
VSSKTYSIEILLFYSCFFVATQNVIVNRIPASSRNFLYNKTDIACKMLRKENLANYYIYILRR